MERPHAPSNRPDMDGLRAIAILPVVVYHALPSALPGGYVGVDVFLVISGFLITGQRLETLDGGALGPAAFYARRARRLFPAWLAVLAACPVTGWFTTMPDDDESIGGHVAASAAFVESSLLRSEAGDFDAASATKPLLHLWSPSIEAQFYLARPLLLRGLGR
ncbi:MAG: acyltransferase [Burkholderiales bacterium]